jgi:hypothetical protein
MLFFKTAKYYNKNRSKMIFPKMYFLINLIRKSSAGICVFLTGLLW